MLKATPPNVPLPTSVVVYFIGEAVTSLYPGISPQNAAMQRMRENFIIVRVAGGGFVVAQHARQEPHHRIVPAPDRLMQRRGMTVVSWRVVTVGVLAGVEAGGPTALNRCLARYALRSRMPGVAVVLTDLLDAGGYADGLKALLQRRFDVFLLHVVSEDELAPGLQGDLTLVDAEGGTAREVSVDRWALERYQERLAQHFDAAERFCARHGIDYLRTSTAMPSSMGVANRNIMVEPWMVNSRL